MTSPTDRFRQTNVEEEVMEGVGEEEGETVESVLQSLLHGKSDEVIRSRRRDLPELLHR